MRPPGSRRYSRHSDRSGGPDRALTVVVALLLAAGCAAAPVPSTAPAPPAPPVALPLPAPEPPLAPMPVGIACGGEFDGASPRFRLDGDLPFTGTLGAPAALGLELLGEGPDCGGRVVLAPADDPVARTLAATTAVLRGAPLLLLPGADPDPAGLPAAARTIVTRRLDAVGIGEREVVTGVSTDAQAAALVALLEAHPDEGATVVLVDVTDVAAQAESVAQVAAGLRPLVVDTARDDLDVAALLAPLRALEMAPALRWSASTTALADAFAALGLADLGVAPLVAGDGTTLGTADGSSPVELWLGDVRAPGSALVAAVAAAVRGGAYVAVDGADLRSGAERTARIRTLGDALPDDAPVVLVGGGADADWQLDTVLDGTPLPGGGFLPLEDRRIVALYGSPGAPSLGLLGEQDLESTLERAREFAAGYEDAVDGRTVVPGLDVITTVASSAPEPTGDYSRRIPIDRLRPLVDRAGEEGMVVLLDLQPGRTDFLTQAQEYEELLREPHVHLALDPEWRIGPTERHLERIGSVEAAEVQAVADWLAVLVRRERLPQKVLMLHQFLLEMLRDRDTVVIPPELVGVVHVDGQGPLPTKDRTYAAMTDGAEERWAWGWKNFTRIDVPMATPERTLARYPIPVIVTYQ